MTFHPGLTGHHVDALAALCAEDAVNHQLPGTRCTDATPQGELPGHGFARVGLLVLRRRGYRDSATMA